MDEAPLSANFVMYRGGMRIQHTVRSDGSLQEHVALLDAYISLLEQAGQTKTEAGLEEGQESYDVDAYVIGKTKKGDKVLWFYADFFEYAVRGGAVYEDHWKDLPFTPDTSRIFDGEQKPSRDYAKEKGFWRPQQAKIIIRNTGKLTDAGKPMWRFVSAHAPGQTLPKVPPAAPADSMTPEQMVEVMKEHFGSEKIQTIEQLLKAALKAWGRKEQIGEAWPDVQWAIRLRITQFVNQLTTDESRERLLAAVRAMAQILPEGYADDLAREITQQPDVPF